MQSKLWPLLAGFALLFLGSSQCQDEDTFLSDTLFRAAALNATNAHRKEHNSSNLYWNQTLSDYAENWSSGCRLLHSKGPYGENLALGYSNVSAAITAWADEKYKYNFDNPQYSDETGHFTQLVWRATTSVGCGRSDCRNGSSTSTGWILVCEYYVAGNVLGDFAQNVHRALHTPRNKTVDHSEDCATKGPGHTQPGSSRTEITNYTVLPMSVHRTIHIGLWIAMEEH